MAPRPRGRSLYAPTPPICKQTHVTARARSYGAQEACRRRHRLGNERNGGFQYCPGTPRRHTRRQTRPACPSPVHPVHMGCAIRRSRRVPCRCPWHLLVATSSNLRTIACRRNAECHTCSWSLFDNSLCGSLLLGACPVRHGHASVPCGSALRQWLTNRRCRDTVGPTVGTAAGIPVDRFRRLKP